MAGAIPISELYCYEDELPCELTTELFAASIVDGVRLYPWWAVARQLEKEKKKIDCSDSPLEDRIEQFCLIDPAANVQIQFDTNVPFALGMSVYGSATSWSTKVLVPKDIPKDTLAKISLLTREIIGQDN